MRAKERFGLSEDLILSLSKDEVRAAEEEVMTKLSIEVTEGSLDRIEFLARGEGIFVEEMSKRLLADNAETQAGLVRGPIKRKYMYR